MQVKNWVTPEQIAQARQMDLYTYLGRYEPGELVHVRGDVYSTRSHDSLKISSRTGKWFRWSTGDGGHTAQKFEAEFYAKPDLREVAPPAPYQPTIDLAALIEQIQQSPETAALLANILAVQPATT